MFFYVLQQANGGRFRLRDLLAVPMQRVLKYHLLLRELLSHTSISHEEYPHVQQAYEGMLDVAGQLIFANQVAFSDDNNRLTCQKQLPAHSFTPSPPRIGFSQLNCLVC